MLLMRKCELEVLTHFHLSQNQLFPVRVLCCRKITKPLSASLNLVNSNRWHASLGANGIIDTCIYFKYHIVHSYTFLKLHPVLMTDELYIYNATKYQHGQAYPLRSFSLEILEAASTACNHQY